MEPERYEIDDSTSSPVVLFDGVCNLCNGWVNFVIDRDPSAVFRFAALQSEAANELLEGAKYTPRSASIVVVENDIVHDQSDAVLRIARRLSWPWPLTNVFWIVPRPLRDALYAVIARNRYNWFGMSDTCRVPTPELRSRFLDDGRLSSTDT